MRSPSEYEATREAPWGPALVEGKKNGGDSRRQVLGSIGSFSGQMTKYPSAHRMSLSYEIGS